MLHPHTELRWVNEPIGVGVFATKHIPKGTVLWALDALGQTISPRSVNAMGRDLRSLIDTYTFRN